MDHNEKTQAVDGIEEADILEIIDHHRLGAGIETVVACIFQKPAGRMYGNNRVSNVFREQCKN